MKSAVYYGREDIRLCDRPEPSLRDSHSVKIKVRCCGICGSDLEEYYYGPVVAPTSVHPLTGCQIPITLGHEFSGEIVEVGEDVSLVKCGDLVVCNPVLGCGECDWCKKGVPCLCEQMACIGLQSDGAFAEYIVVPEANCMLLPEGAPMDAITLVEPCATAIRNVRRGQVTIGDNVLVIGAGTVGLLTIQAARLAGAATVSAIELNDFRCRTALAMGADAAFSPFEEDLKEKLRAVTKGRGVNVVIECTGHSSSPTQALELVEKGGSIVLVGICPEPSALLTRNIARAEIDLYGVHGYTRDDLRDATAAIQAGKIDVQPLITDRIPFDKVVSEGFDKLGPRGEKNIKIIVDMTL